jgi:RNA polymerase sigma factor (TIGR02999 family)
MVDPPPPEDVARVAHLLGEVGAGDGGRSDEMLPLVYDDLRRIAAARVARLAPGQTLQATDVVHEAYGRLARRGPGDWKDRAHFLGVAARAMRDILADHLQRKGSLKRGGHLRRVSEDTVAEFSNAGPSDDVLALEEVLQDFAREFPRKAEVVTHLFFGGMTAAESALVLGVSERTVERDWSFARAWLNSRLADPGAAS